MMSQCRYDHTNKIMHWVLRGINDGIACFTSRGTQCQDHEGKVAFTVESLTRKVAWSHILILHAVVATIDRLLIFHMIRSQHVASSRDAAYAGCLH